MAIITCRDPREIERDRKRQASQAYVDQRAEAHGMSDAELQLTAVMVLQMTNWGIGKPRKGRK